MDRLTPEARSANMRAVRSKNTSPEMRVRRTAHRIGLRFRLHRRDLPGSPDLVFPKYSTVAFVHGCFWHRHPNCQKASLPKTRRQFWKAKFDRNEARDATNENLLRDMGWNVIVIWECMTRSDAEIERCLTNGLGLEMVSM
ncbi:MAG TPA: DNA mismatch endonuclease Vsr [Aurantimonas coralicida]|uniref:Very short patch repair endonuclease n=2 Tax=root TaxID=1 RepID=A0A9C9TGI1_9HYPH|nr:DNA mismatch endonuclease Vsr [Aurantimonas coralicida]HEU00199.1 DNA mismatch endonuclease Vsr [Aurantimonas coralicida]